MSIIKNKIIVSCLIVITCLISDTLYSQLKSNSPISPSGNLQQLQQATDNANLMLQEQLSKDVYPIGNIIDASVYKVGPNDLLSIQVLPVDMVAQSIVVTSECTIVHPLFNEISVKGLTLQAVRDTLTSIISSRKGGAKVIVSLIQPRRVFVNIRGNVISPGTYTLPASYSVSTAIKFANQSQVSTGQTIDEQSANSRLQEARKERERIFNESGLAEASSYWSRNIRLVRGSGTAMIVDVERAIATDDASYDPFISEGDEIFVPFEESNNYPTISIAGEVLRPATVVYKSGDMLSHLLKMGYGLTSDANLDDIYLYSSNSSPLKLSVDSNFNLLNADIPLTSSSVIIVGSKPEVINENIALVSVKGEVNKPNIYRITPGETKLSDIIQAAGGFTDKAYLPLATIGRRDNSQNDRVPLRRKYNEYFQYSIMTQQDTLRFGVEMDMKKPMVSCDFVAALQDDKEEHNVLLQDGDVIEIPQKPNKINVFGQVNYPGYVDFVDGQTMEWYIEKAGGYATNAEKSRARIIRGSNRVWVDGFKENIYVNDGDEIFVSPPRDVPPEMELQKWAAWAGMASVAITLINVLWSIYRDSR